jgi:2-methylcitrate dehydratase PrpD
MLGSTDEQLLELPLGKARQEMTEEMILKKTEKNRKRRQAAQRRKEKRKVLG